MALSRMCSCTPKQLGNGMKYHYSLLYNVYEGPPNRRQGDYLLAWNFLTDLNERLSTLGYDSVMYDDIAIPGSNIFDNLFSMVNESEKIVVLLTPEFITNGWNKYAAHAAIKNILDKHACQSKLIPIAINIPRERIPEHFGFSVSKILFTDYLDQTVNDGFWRLVHKAIGRTELHYEQNGNLHSEACILSAPPAALAREFSSLEIDGPENSTEQSHSSDDGYRSDSDITKSVHSPMSNEMASINVRSRDNSKETSRMVCKTDLEQTQRIEVDGSPSDSRKGRPQSDSSSNFSGDSPPKSLIYRVASWLWEKRDYLF